MNSRNNSVTTAHESAIDPVCGMTVDPQRAAGSFEYSGQTYYFCALGCREKFKADPEKYLAPKPVTPIGIQRTGRQVGAIAPESETYTCPMHPEVVRDAPESCPICGMALEPRIVTLEEGKNPELVDMTRRLWVSATLSLPLLVIGMSEMLPANPITRVAPMRSIIWLQLALATPVVWW